MRHRMWRCTRSSLSDGVRPLSAGEGRHLMIASVLSFKMEATMPKAQFNTVFDKHVPEIWRCFCKARAQPREPSIASTACGDSSPLNPQAVQIPNSATIFSKSHSRLDMKQVLRGTHFQNVFTGFYTIGVDHVPLYQAVCQMFVPKRSCRKMSN